MVSQDAPFTFLPLKLKGVLRGQAATTNCQVSKFCISDASIKRPPYIGRSGRPWQQMALVPANKHDGSRKDEAVFEETVYFELALSS
jgi:hypothetical protein